MNRHQPRLAGPGRAHRRARRSRRTHRARYSRCRPRTRHTLSAPADLWDRIDALYAWLTAHRTRGGHEDLLLRLLKLPEEVGEATAAVIGALGHNPRKGVSHTWQDVEAELCDIAVTALVALRMLTPDARDVFAHHLDRVTRRSLAGGTVTDATE
ncbi:hypothetical protein GCM10010389_05270 [Streptomyces echinoruber]|uniref:NTP pyrophosphohydrolase MazG putative catalytic core domain-containing protein n=1 Tax=Streptomyces echinoruber TaxID=68898 RepID=A0A918QT47_9ACTN|nr:hypothetical protein GCM10010389_05270 [Streptomyces echinoruber]